MPDLSDLRRELGLLSEDEVAALRGKTVSTLQKERSADCGPPWIKDGHTILYFRDDLLAWLKARTCVPDPRVEGEYNASESSSLYARSKRLPLR